MMTATLLLIALTAALPSIYTAGQREREEELIFRGTQYARAIALFRRQFRRYPTSVKELIETNGIRFLRREYPDPMSPKGKWRLIHADASGTPLDSRTLSRPTMAAAGRPLSPSAGSQTQTGEEASRPLEAEQEGGETSAFFGGVREIRGAFIIGVASTRRRESIRKWNGRTRYDEWEFLGVEMTPGGGGASPVGQPSPPGQPSSPQPSGPGPHATTLPMDRFLSEQPMQ